MGKHVQLWLVFESREPKDIPCILGSAIKAFQDICRSINQILPLNIAEPKTRTVDRVKELVGSLQSLSDQPQIGRVLVPTVGYKYRIILRFQKFGQNCSVRSLEPIPHTLLSAKNTVSQKQGA